MTFQIICGKNVQEEYPTISRDSNLNYGGPYILQDGDIIEGKYILVTNRTFSDLNSQFLMNVEDVDEHCKTNGKVISPEINNFIVLKSNQLLLWSTIILLTLGVALPDFIDFIIPRFVPFAWQDDVWNVSHISAPVFLIIGGFLGFKKLPLGG